jgi:hypothetical protein
MPWRKRKAEKLPAILFGDMKEELGRPGSRKDPLFFRDRSLESIHEWIIQNFAHEKSDSNHQPAERQYAAFFAANDPEASMICCQPAPFRHRFPGGKRLPGIVKLNKIIQHIGLMKFSLNLPLAC